MVAAKNSTAFEEGSVGVNTHSYSDADTGFKDTTEGIFKRNVVVEVGGDGSTTILDSQWAKHSFLVNAGTVAALGGAGADGNGPGSRLFVSSADRKYTDSSMGGSIGVGARPQFTRYSDNRSVGALADRSPAGVGEHMGNNGMGRIYSEKYDDTAEIVFMRFGVPQFNSLAQFFTEFADSEVTRLAITGQSDATLYKVGQAVGALTVLIAAPLLSMSVYTLKTLKDWFFNRRTSKFYTIKPTMHLYWSTVNTMVNTLAVNRGLISRPYQVGSGSLITPTSLSEIMNQYMPKLISAGGFIDTGMIANKAQRRSNHLNKHLDGGGGKARGDLGISNGEIILPGEVPSKSFHDIVSAFAGVDEWYTAKQHHKQGTQNQYKPVSVHQNMSTTEPDKTQHTGEGSDTVFGKLRDSLKAEIQQGSQWAIFRVDSVKSQSESFTNSVKTNEVADKFNAQSSNVRDIKFNYAGGNIGNDAASNTVESAMSSAAEVIKGVASGITFGLSDAVADLLAGVTMEMPKYWDAANAELSTSDYSMTLISPYNNAWSHMQNIYIPLCMILAGALPIKSGAQSHVSPLLCSIYNKGKSQKAMGMITSVSIERGVTSMPFDIAGHALSMSVSISVTDLAPCMSVPMSTGQIFNGLGAIGNNTAKNKQLDEDSAIFDFLATLAAMTVAEQGDGFTAAQVRIDRGLTALQSMLSPSAWALQGYEALLSNPITTIPTRIVTAIAKSNATITEDNRQSIGQTIGR